MAVLGLSAATISTIGTVLQFAALAAQIAMMATAKGPTVEGPRLNDTRAPTSTYGKMIPFGYDKGRVAANLIWSTDIVEVREKKKVGGKGAIIGGPTSSVISYHYFGNFAMIFGEGPGVVRRIWADNKIIYDVRDPLTFHSKYPEAVIRTYQGNEIQVADTAIETDKGIGNVPAYRGMIYCVFENLPLLDFGNRIPAIEAEVAFGTPTVPADQEVADTDNYGMLDIAYSEVLRSIYMITNPAGPESEKIVRIDSDTNTLAAETARFPFGDKFTGTFEAEQVHPGDDGRLFVFGKDTGGATTRHLVELDPLTLDFKKKGDGTSEFSAKGVNQDWGTDEVGGESATFTWKNPSGQSWVVTLVFALGSDGLTDTGSKLLLYYRAKGPGAGPNGSAIADSHQFTITGGAPGDAVRMFGGTVDDDGNFWIVGYTGTDAGSGSPATRGTLWKIKIRETLPLPILTGIAAFATAGSLALPYEPGGQPGLAMDVQEKRDLGADGVHEPHIIVWDHVTKTLVIEGKRNANGFAKWIRYDPKEKVIVVSRTLDTVGNAQDDDEQGSINDNRRLIKSYQHGTYQGEYIKGNNAGAGQWYAIRALDLTAREITGNTPSSSISWTLGFHDRHSNSVWISDDAVPGPDDGVLRHFYEADDVAPVFIDDIIIDVMARVGLEVSDYSIEAALASIQCKGFVLGRQAPARGVLDPLMFQYLFDVHESDYLLKFLTRGQASVRTILEADLGARPGDRGDPDVLTEKRVQEADLPVRIDVQYSDFDRDFQEGSQYAKRIENPFKSVQSEQIRAVQLPILLTADEARQTVEAQLFATWLKRASYEFTLPARHLDLDPTDAITVTRDDGTSFFMAIAESDLGEGFVSKINARAENLAVYSSTVLGAVVGVPTTELLPPGATRLFLMDLPLLADEQENPSGSGVYVGFGAYKAGWKGAIAQRSIDGIAYTQWEVAITDTPWGTLAEDVPALPMKPDGSFHELIDAWDGVTTITVNVVQGIDQLESLTDEQILGGTNGMIIGDQVREGDLLHPGVEIAQYVTVNVVSTDGFGGGVVELTRLARGRRASEWKAVEGHSAGVQVVFLDNEVITRKPLPVEDIYRDRWYRAASNGGIIEAMEIHALLLLGNDLRPYAPIDHAVDLAPGARGGSDINVTWTRRARTGGNEDFLDGVDSPLLGEASESYIVALMDQATGLVESFTYTTDSDSTGVDIPSADRVTAGYGAEDAVTVVVYQLSETIGRGFGGRRTL